MQRHALAAAVLLAVTPLAQADDIDNLQVLGQAQFRLLSEDLGAALSYKPVAPAEPLGLLGFDFGVEATATNLHNNDIYKLATGSSSTPSDVIVPKVHVHKGLPLGINVDAFYSSVPSSNIELIGGAIGFALIKGGMTMPALTLRATATKLSGVDQLDFDTKGVELTISKGFAFVTPYAGIGRVEVTSEPKGNAAAAPVSLTEESFGLDKAYVGVNINLGLANLAFEGDKTGDAASYSAKFGFRF
jgi:hypothetical protein